ncbi:AraC family transcriptional regulator [Dyadobacter subterraneus]|uniref:AraC family transcriptional regulator n=1 Tax=Dyadobacter subterraneus TaxID=2773304 RepID=A0ABR9WI34_9BACT|nr:AraC family transcriptional regulator [Dyadobacter subterraneus]MBE9464016.1 AraC family transcriptional regulator [Dyadobacter subterraneus]
MKQKKDIPILLLKEITRHGLKITRYKELDDQDILFKAAHRDDHYIFVFQLQGTSRIMVDFKEIALEGCAILCILPGQVHRGVSADKVEALFIAIETALIKDSLRHIFEEKVPQQAITHLAENDSILLEQSIDLLVALSEHADKGSLQLEIIRSLTDTCTGMIACEFDAVEDSNYGSTLRSVIITKQFKRYLSQSYHIERTPSGYAKRLNISASYLNEVVKQVTGFSASYWIQQQVIMEAKRVLFYTDYSVKEISSILGFEDQHYFSRFFKKGTGMSPMIFKQQYRK